MLSLLFPRTPQTLYFLDVKLRSIMVQVSLASTGASNRSNPKPNKVIYIQKGGRGVLLDSKHLRSCNIIGLLSRGLRGKWYGLAQFPFNTNSNTIYFIVTNTAPGSECNQCPGLTNCVATKLQQSRILHQKGYLSPLSFQLGNGNEKP